jgi:hypothetical protein
VFRYAEVGKEEIIMKKYLWPVIAGTLCCFLVLMAGCASSELVNIWSDPSFQPPSLNTMLVISVLKNSVQRRMWEDAFTVELANHNVKAVPSYRLFPDAVPDTSQIIQVVHSKGFDGILVYRRLPAETDIQYRQGFGMSEHNFVYDHFTGSFVFSYYRDQQYAAFTDSQKVDIRVIDIWATKNEGRMIWRATSKTPEPNAIQEVRPEIVELVISELTKRNIIALDR